MKTAISQYLGGATIDAADANYDSSIDLGLLCPFCGRPVFLVGGSTRQRYEKTEHLPPHFSHYRAESETAKLCEARAITKEGREYLQQLQPEARGQRLTAYNRRLWDMIIEEKDAPRNCKTWLKLNAPQLQSSTRDLIAHCLKHWRDPEERSQIKAAMPKLVEHLTPETIAAAVLGRPSDDPSSQAMEIARSVSETWKHDLSRQLHWAICAEVTDYLAQKESEPVFEKLIYLAMFDRLNFHPARNEPIHSQQIMEICLGSIALTRWEAMLEKFSQPRRGDGFGRRTK